MVFKRCPCRDGDGRSLRNCRKDHGTWWYKVETVPDIVTRKRRQIAKGGFRTRADAEQALTKVQHDVDQGLWADDRSLTVGEWLTAWLAEVGERRGAKTAANYRNHVRDAWLPHVGRIRLRDLRRHHVEAVLAVLGEPVTVDPDAGNVGRRVSQRSASTIDGYRRTLRASLSVARRRGLIAVNPAEGQMDAIPQIEHPEMQIWEPEQTARFLDHVQGDRLAALYELAAYAGMRRAELCGLRWSDLDPDGAGITLRQTVIEVASKDLRPADRICPVCGEEHTSLLIKRPKSRAGLRWIPLVTNAQRALAERRAAVAAERKACGAGYCDHDLVFSHVDGRPLRPGSITLAFQRHVEASGLPVIRLHDTRHGACSLLLAAGVPIEIVQMILGHSTPDITRRVYAHVMKKLTAEQVAKAAALIDRHRRGHSADSGKDTDEEHEGGSDVS